MYICFTPTNFWLKCASAKIAFQFRGFRFRGLGFVGSAAICGWYFRYSGVESCFLQADTTFGVCYEVATTF